MFFFLSLSLDITWDPKNILSLLIRRYGGDACYTRPALSQEHTMLPYVNSSRGVTKRKRAAVHIDPLMFHAKELFMKAPSYDGGQEEVYCALGRPHPICRVQSTKYKVQNIKTTAWRIEPRRKVFGFQFEVGFIFLFFVSYRLGCARFSFFPNIFSSRQLDFVLCTLYFRST